MNEKLSTQNSRATNHYVSDNREDPTSPCTPEEVLKISFITAPLGTKN